MPPFQIRCVFGPFISPGLISAISLGLSASFLVFRFDLGDVENIPENDVVLLVRFPHYKAGRGLCGVWLCLVRVPAWD